MSRGFRPLDDMRTLAWQGVDEVNLSQFPVCLISERNPGRLEQLECRQSLQAPDGTVIDQSWRVEGDGGLPLAGDGELLLALVNLGYQQRVPDQIQASRYRLLKIMGKTPDGRGYKRLEQGLERLSRVRVVARRAFWNGEEYLSRSFGLVAKYRLEADDTYVCLDETLIQSLRRGNILNLDLEEYFRVSGYLARRLYRYLNRFAVRGGTFERNLKSLATTNLGMLPGRQVSPSQYKQSLDRAHEALKARGFLESWEYIRERPRWFVAYRFGPMASGQKPWS